MVKKVNAHQSETVEYIRTLERVQKEGFPFQMAYAQFAGIP